MINTGVRIVAASYALVFEDRPTGRTNLSWVVRRAIRNGGTIVEVDWEAHERTRRFRQTLQAGLDGLSHAVQAARYWRGERAEAARHLVQACQEIGKVLRQTGIIIEEFRSHS